ncbi:MAG: hypothetical protein HGA85_04670 [Nanoarchaeota archaeon]|nr:hypothetical protein [Nanoarchaeota archaeon]
MLPVRLRLLGIEKVNEDLAIFRFSCGKTLKFSPGQFCTLTLSGTGRLDQLGVLAEKDEDLKARLKGFSNGKVTRAYSIASRPGIGLLELIIQKVNDGGLLPPGNDGKRAGIATTELFSWVPSLDVDVLAASAAENDVSIGFGRFTPPDNRIIVLVATGTGNAPFMSIIREEYGFEHIEKKWNIPQKHRKIVFIHAVKRLDDLHAYAGQLIELEKMCDTFTYIPLCTEKGIEEEKVYLKEKEIKVLYAENVFVNRQEKDRLARPNSLDPNEIDSLVKKKTLASAFQKITGKALSPSLHYMMFCGNPYTGTNIEKIAKSLGFSEKDFAKEAW